MGSLDLNDCLYQLSIARNFSEGSSMDILDGEHLYKRDQSSWKWLDGKLRKPNMLLSTSFCLKQIVLVPV